VFSNGLGPADEDDRKQRGLVLAMDAVRADNSGPVPALDKLNRAVV
jgi:hypothetical protein